MKTNNPCTVCSKPGLPGLLRGHGKCQYHWNVANWGQEWADKIAADQKITERKHHEHINRPKLQHAG